jgi:hypothetical protein
MCFQELAMKFSGETLMAYAGDEFDARNCRKLGARSEQPAPSHMARHRTLRTALRTGFAPVLQETVSQSSIDAGASAAPATDERHLDRHWQSYITGLKTWHKAAIIAAIALVAGVAVGRTVNLAPSSDVTTLAGRMLAGGTLATALFEQAGGVEPLQSEVLIGLSYLAKAGVYCRTFTMKQNESIAGIACREADGWNIQALAQTGPKSPLTQYRMAGTRVPPLLMGVVESTIDGSPLDTDAESAARQRQWLR